MMANSSNSEEKWYLKPIFTSFWNYYNQCNEWLEQNGHKMVEFSDEINDIECQNCSKCDISLNDIKSSEDKESAIEVIERNHKKLDALESIEENEFINNNHKTNEELIPFDKEVVEISEEYLQFIMKTKRHQMERKKLREKRLRYNDRVEYVDISRMDSFSRRGIAPKKVDKNDSTNHSNDKQLSSQQIKQQKMFELYGEDYNVIQGMEAALQLNFDRLCDLNQPNFWPIMPIRIIPKKTISFK